MSLNLVIKKSGASGAAKEVSVDVDPSSTVADLKEQIAASVELPAENIRLVCAGRVWDNVATVASYSPAAGSVVHCLNNPTRAVPAAAAQTLTAVNPMQQMMSQMPQMSSDPNDPFAQMEAQMHQQMMQNPEMMQQMLNSPMMQQLMSDPETMRNMMRMNPRMNRLMEERPEIARMMEDPEVMQQSMRMMQNPELMREMVRNQDRAMGNLDVMPGGHQALVSAHQDFLDPMYAAMQGGGSSGTSGVDQPVYNNTATVNNEALSNPWGAPAPATAPAAPAVASSSVRASPASGQTASAHQPSTGSPNAQQAGLDPMAHYVQQMMSNPQMMQTMMGGSDLQSLMGMGGTAQATETPNPPPPSPFQPGVNPMQQMMQQMMQNPAIMQQAAVMRQQMMNSQAQANGGAPNPMQQMMQQMMNPQGPAPMGAANPAPAANPMQPNPTQPNPMQQMLQQMMNPQGAPAGGNPAGGAAGGASPNPMQQMLQQMSAGQQGAGAGAGTAAVPESVLKLRFASQLVQLANMGFSDESMCLRALSQHNGRLDSAIDTLLTGGIE